MKPVHIFLFCFFKNHYNITLPFKPRISNLSISFRFAHNKPTYIEVENNLQYDTICSEMLKMYIHSNSISKILAHVKPGASNVFWQRATAITVG
jgi:hypothetical protein